jgi:hypothetical protein
MQGIGGEPEALRRVLAADPGGAKKLICVHRRSVWRLTVGERELPCQTRSLCRCQRPAFALPAALSRCARSGVV